VGWHVDYQDHREGTGGLCDLETPARDAFLSYLAKESKILDGGRGFGKWVIYLKKIGALHE
jgi:hypothetical protein